MARGGCREGAEGGRKRGRQDRVAEGKMVWFFADADFKQSNPEEMCSLMLQSQPGH